MIREEICTGKSIEEAIEAACAKLGVNQDDRNVSVEVLEMPVRKLFRTIPAKAKVTVEVEDPTPAPAPAAAPVAEPAAPAPAQQQPAAETPAEAPAKVAEAQQDEEIEVDIDPEQNEKVKAAIEYLTEVFAAMGVTGVEFHPVQKGEATILHVTGG